MHCRDFVRSHVEHAASARHADVVKALTDFSLILAAGTWAWLASVAQTPHLGNLLPFLAIVASVRLAVYFGLGLHRTSWRHVSRYEVAGLGVSAALAAPLIGLILVAVPRPLMMELMPRPYITLATEAALYLLLLGSVRFLTRALIGGPRNGSGHDRTLILGAGDAGRTLALVIQESNTEWHIVGFLDDDPQKRGRRIRGLPVLGPIADVVEIVSAHRVAQLVVAIPSLPPQRLREILIACEPTGLPLRIVPPVRELMGAKPDPGSLRQVRMEDLLPRPEVKLDPDLIAGYLKDRTVLVTGGGGSIGRELCRQVPAAGPARLIVLDHAENGAFEIIQELSERNGQCEIVPVICDVRDHAALDQVFRRYRPNVVFHAAAHKHVPLMESHPAEAVKTNVLGTANLVSLVAEYGVERFVLVSTDKAVNPTSVMGATKRLGEMIVSAYAAVNGGNMVSVRFGNVLGSRGSVTEVMTSQIRSGLPVTVTDPEMVRYFMTIPEAVQLILQAGALGGKGEICVLDMGHPVRIVDLAENLIRLSGLVPYQDVPIRIIGRRPGEKVREELITGPEARGCVRKGHCSIIASEPVDLAGLLESIEVLRVAAETNGGDAVVKTLQRIVPTYRPDVAGDRLPVQATLYAGRA